MVLIWLIYISVFVASLAFLVLYKDVLALILFIVIVALPLLLLISLVVTKLLTKITAEIKDGVIKNGETAMLKITVKNRSPFSIGAISIKMKCDNSFLNASSVCKTVISAKAFSTECYNFAITSEHIGRLNIYLKRAWIYDRFHLFAFSQKLNTAAAVSFVPAVSQLTLRVGNNSFLVGESDIFSKTKPGDDPSEIFNIRDYKGGDKLNRIHWKLSVKQNHYMVKDYSFPINESVMLFTDLCVDSADSYSLSKIDTMYEAFMSVSYELIAQKKLFFICWYHAKTGRFMSEKIASPEDVYMCLGEIYTSSIGENYPDILADSFTLRNYISHVCLFTSRDKSAMQKSVQAYGNKKIRYSAIVADVAETAETDEGLPLRDEDDGLLIYPVRNGHVADDLLDFML